MSMALGNYLEEQIPFHSLTLLSFVAFLIFLYKYTTPAVVRGNPPPSPPKLPILGNLHQLGRLPHRSLRALSQQYGELMSLQIGRRPSLVVSSADAAREIMKTHDAICSNRPNLHFPRRLMYDGKDVVFSSYGEYWRQIKSICVVQLLNNKKVQSFQSIREEETALLLGKLKASSSSIVNLSEMTATLTFDIIYRATFGKKCTGDNEAYFKELMDEFMVLMGVFSIGDTIPWLSWIDRVNGLEGRVEKLSKKLDKFLEKVIREYQDCPKTIMHSDCKSDKGDEVKNFVDILLKIQTENQQSLATETTKALVLDMFTAGAATVHTLLEWAMTELLRHPRAMKQLQEEVREIVRGKARVTEDDLKRMSFLKAVIKETLRLHPPAPLLIFREPSHDIKINGYDIAAKTQVIINAWAIQTDPASWEEPEEFRPERFLNSAVDFRGQDFQLIPFGAGRRGCPGISFSMVTAELIIASLVNEFDWGIPGREESETLEVFESAGVIVRNQDPLMVIATPYSCKE